MAHGTPIGRADDGKRYGRKGAFLLEAGISSSYHITKFFGLTHWIRDARPALPQSPSTRLIPAVSLTAPAVTALRPKAERPQVAEPEPAPLVQAVPERANLQPTPLREASQPKRKVAPKKREKQRRVLDEVGGKIVRALISAGLMLKRQP